MSMDCTEFEQLVDPYLSGELSGVFRLEMDAHRLRCPRCQQTVAMLESLRDALRSDSDTPRLSDDFADRVMAAVHERRMAPEPNAPRRLLLWAPGLAAAAAVLVFSLWPQSVTPASERDEPAPGITVLAPAGDGAQQLAIFNEVLDRIESRIHQMHQAGRSITSDTVQLAEYLNLDLPADVAAQTHELLASDPFTGFWKALVPPAASPLDRSGDEFAL